jgi:hypothetical protein
VTINNGENVLRRIARQLVIPGLAIATALIVSVPVIGFATDWDWAKIGTTYGGLLDGAFFKGYAFANTLVAATPLIFTGLALALGFRGGVFNIGAAGQFLIGATCGVFVGYAISLPPVIHPFAALLAGAIGGGLWGAIPGFLKARFGSHEVINTDHVQLPCLLSTRLAGEEPDERPLSDCYSHTEDYRYSNSATHHRPSAFRLCFSATRSAVCVVAFAEDNPRL